MKVLVAFLLLASASLSAEIKAYYNPGCGCCESYFSKLEKEGIKVKRVRVDSSKLDEAKNRLGVPLELRSCHTMEYKGRFIEGHVPPEGVRRALSNSSIRGTASPHGVKSGMGSFEDHYFVVGRDNNVKEIRR